ncbi:MAG: hypothetical protein IKI69_08035 [Oscillospiraceae bacterium]|nr:hypothetical protein [Oscillospiraceae bacterium]
MIDRYEELYGFSFSDRKDFYAAHILTTKNDYEFYCVMSAISQEIPSFHTDFVEPDLESYRSLHCFNSAKITSNRKILSACEYWNKLVLEQTDQLRQKPFYCFSYVNGQYAFDSTGSSEHDKLSSCILLAVGDEPIDDFIKSHLLIYNLYFDGLHNKPCRTKIVFNGAEGIPVRLMLLNERGEHVSVELYYSLYYEEAYRHMAVSEVPDYFILEGDGYSLVQLNTFRSQIGEELSDAMQSLRHDYVILDLRNCYGGNQDFAAKYLYPNLFDRTYTVSKTWYVPKSATNEPIYKNIFNRILYQFQNTMDSPYSNQSEYMISTTQRKYQGGRIGKKNIVVLTSQKTGSAADEFVSIAKRYHLVTVVGDNTGGEGLAGSYMVTTCPNSLLAFVYMPGGALNPDGTDNSVYGTSPDVYISQTLQDYSIQKYIEKYGSNDSQDPLLYDTVLQKAIEILLS